MKSIVLISVLIGLLFLFILWRVFSVIRKKVLKKSVSLKKQGVIVGVSIIILLSLIVYDAFLVANAAYDNKDEILNFGQKTVSESVTYGTTAVFEGIGGTMEHFQEKWDKEYQKKLDQLDITVYAFRQYSINESTDEVELTLIVNNSNPVSNKIDIDQLFQQNSLLIGDTAEVYYPLTPASDYTTYVLPQGKSRMHLMSSVPSSSRLESVRFMNRKIRLSKD